jgi:hypothetical protein
MESFDVATKFSTGSWIIRAFRKCGIARVSFADGSAVEFSDREGLTYSEPDGHTLGINFYFQRGRLRGRLLIPREIQHWDPPHQRQLISDAKRDEIREKVALYCKRRRIPLVVE